MDQRKVVSRTHFRRRNGKNGWQWYWTTFSLNNLKIGVGGEGYDRISGAINGFFAQQGINIQHAQLRSDFGPVEKFDDGHYVVVKYANQQQENQEK